MPELTAKDIAATGLTTLAVLTFLATRAGWNVALVGDSHRWAAGVISLLGVVTCALGERAPSSARRQMAGLGILAGVLAVAAVATGSLTPLSLLVIDIVLLWGFATIGHARHKAHKTVAT